MKKNLFLLVFPLLVTTSLFAQNPDTPKPKLVVGIVIDQMRYDYITRYWSKFGDNGFKKLIREGINCTNTHYNYVPTKTAPGHASIYSGTTPAVHGIIGNDYYDKRIKKRIYAAYDTTVTGVGTLPTNYSGKMSPKNLISSNISDELRLASNFRSKVISVAIKDRSSVMPAGHAANGAYWYESATGNWISSSYYIKTLPSWVTDFNNKKLPAYYLKEPWTTLLPIDQYTESTPDDNLYEELYRGETKPVFPHNFHLNDPDNYDMIRKSHLGNIMTREFAVQAMKGEKLGQDDFTDLLAISFSSPDEIGHQFGTHAIETEDTYLRLDIELAKLISEIESYAGKGNVLFFLTADHAVIPNVAFLADNKMPGGLFSTSVLNDTLNKFLIAKYGQQKWIEYFYDNQYYLNHELLREFKINTSEITYEICQFVLKYKGVADVLTADDLSKNEYTFGIRSMVQKGFNKKRSGDIVLILEPGLLQYQLKGTDHGSGYAYDTHVPLIFYGWKIKNKTYSGEVDITDIAPTISQILGIQNPSGTTGKVIEFVLTDLR